MAAMWADPIVTRHIGGRAFTEQECWFRLLRYLGHWALLGYGYWAIEEKASGRFAGETGFADFKRELVPPIHGVPEIGWALAPWAHGKGYAAEAVGAAVEWGSQHLPSRRTVCLIDPGNLRSIKLAQNLGYRQYAEATLGTSKTLLFERT